MYNGGQKTMVDNGHNEQWTMDNNGKLTLLDN